ncbi:MAG TPA: ATP-binding protein [Chloroflexota bacterium]|nr:ATP-binding protein [Chloroflexota bacterium]
MESSITSILSGSAPHELSYNELRDALVGAESLLVFNGVLDDAVGRAFLQVLRALADNADVSATRTRAADFFRALANGVKQDRPGSGDAWQHHLVSCIFRDDNPFSRAAGASPFDEIPRGLRVAAEHDLAILGRLAAIDGVRLGARLHEVAEVGGWTDLGELGSSKEESDLATRLLGCPPPGWAELIPELSARYRSHGVGRFATHWGFRWSHGALVPIDRPDPITFDDLIGYTDQRQTVQRNTERFLQNLPASNLLLYGERGTGKSSTVKALLHAYGDKGLRLIEVSKSALGDYVDIIGELDGRSERFILFIDDLSFDENETGYTELKAVLEGGIASRPANVLLYATSNRRHLILERFGDRAAPDDEIHAQDTLQEKLSLADRFGVTVIYLAPDQEQYLAIVAGLARRRGIEVDEAQLHRQALQWAAWNNGRSGRTARQFVDDLTAELKEKGEFPI